MTLQREAARIFCWTSEDNMYDDDDGCDHKHESGGTCSCAVALEIERHGLFSTLHCRFTVSGKHCVHESGCPYSHVELIRACLFFAPHNIVEISWNLPSFVGVSRGGYDCHTATLYDLRGISRWEIYRQLNLHLLIAVHITEISCYWKQSVIDVVLNHTVSTCYENPWVLFSDHTLDPYSLSYLPLHSGYPIPE